MGLPPNARRHFAEKRLDSAYTIEQQKMAGGRQAGGDNSG